MSAGATAVSEREILFRATTEEMFLRGLQEDNDKRRDLRTRIAMKDFLITCNLALIISNQGCIAAV